MTQRFTPQILARKGDEDADDDTMLFASVRLSTPLEVTFAIGAGLVAAVAVGHGVPDHPVRSPGESQKRLVEEQPQPKGRPNDDVLHR
jgi:hypothetical protein